MLLFENDPRKTLRRSQLSLQKAVFCWCFFLFCFVFCFVLFCFLKLVRRSQVSVQKAVFVVVVVVGFFCCCFVLFFENDTQVTAICS